MSAVIYYGTELPDARWAGQVDGDVVLQPYHPLVSDGGFAAAFPLATRFVYINPSAIDPWRLERRAAQPPLLGGDDAWGLPRLDLAEPAGRDAALAEAATAAACGATEIDGLFVDDLDRLSDDPAWVADFFRDLDALLGWEPMLFVNRAFSLWSVLPRLEAVLLEDLNSAPHDPADPEGVLRWAVEVVRGSIEQVRGHDIRVHRLEYADTGLGDARVDEMIAPLLESAHTSTRRQLDVWPSPSLGETESR